jgi:hypothetical protein
MPSLLSALSLERCLSMISFLFVERRWSDFSSAFFSESTVGAFKKDLVYVS